MPKTELSGRGRVPFDLQEPYVRAVPVIEVEEVSGVQLIDRKALTIRWNAAFERETEAAQFGFRGRVSQTKAAGDGHVVDQEFVSLFAVVGDENADV